ncbi:MAG TPA: type I secretion C-terminal target domain-containing protein, partial [Alphaproteobacteria bacterium]|nr:type I secretion C-terminal target domain-containing protein [Alphaproteobacteria bacterium]
GYLANITSQAEQDYVWGLTGNQSVWGGGTDSATEGAWLWSGGSEDGTQYWSGNGSGSAVGGLYSNWIPGQEPWDGGADYDWFILRSQNGGQWYTENSTATYRYVIEWEASSLINSIGTNTLNGGTGADDLYGSVGKEIFVIDQTDAIDEIFNYDTAGGDVIDIKDVLSYSSSTDVLSDFVHITESAGSTQISVDTDGLANGANFTTIAIIDGVTGLDLNTLVSNGNMIVE